MEWLPIPASLQVDRLSVQPFFLPELLILDIKNGLRDLVLKKGVPSPVLGRGLSASARAKVDTPELVSMAAIVAAHVACTEFFHSPSRRSFRDEVASDQRTIVRRIRNPPKRSLRRPDIEDSNTARAALGEEARHHWKREVSASLSLLWLGYSHKGNHISRVTRPILACLGESHSVAPTTPRKLYDSLRHRISRVPEADLPIAKNRFELVEDWVPKIEDTFA